MVRLGQEGADWTGRARAGWVSWVEWRRAKPREGRLGHERQAGAKGARLGQ